MRFRTGSPWRDLPIEYGPWSSAYDRFRSWALAGVFEQLMQEVIGEAAGRGQADLDLVSVDSTAVRAHRHAAGVVLDGELSAALEEAVEQEWGLRQRCKTPPTVPPGDPGDEENRDNDDGDDEGNERRRLRRRYRFRLKAAKLGRSRGGLTSKVHLAADGRCRPLSLILTAGQAGDSPQFRAVLERIKVRLPIGRPCTRPGALAADKAYSSRGNCAYLRRRGIKAVIPEKADQAVRQFVLPAKSLAALRRVSRSQLSNRALSCLFSSSNTSSEGACPADGVLTGSGTAGRSLHTSTPRLCGVHPHPQRLAADSEGPRIFRTAVLWAWPMRPPGLTRAAAASRSSRALHQSCANTTAQAPRREPDGSRTSNRPRLATWQGRGEAGIRLTPT